MNNSHYHVMDQWMLYFVCMFIMQVSECERVEVSSHCVADKFCLRLYNLESGINWQDASTSCKDGGMELLAVHDYNTQQAVMALLQNSGVTKPIWLAGQMASNRQQWKSVNNIHALPSVHISNNSTTTANCLTGSFWPQSGLSYCKAVNCSDTLTGNKLICQVKSSSACSFGGIHLDGYCYILVNETSTDWYRAQSLCHQRYGGDLLYNLPLSYSDIGPLTAWMSEDDAVWFGAFRRQWRWTVKYGDDYVWYNMRYFNWRAGAGWKVTTGYSTLCTVLHGGTGLWEGVTCSNNQQYNICQDEYHEQRTLLPTVGQSRNTVQPTRGLEKYPEITTATIEQITSDEFKVSPGKKAFTPAYIAVIVTGAVIIIVVVLVVILIRKRKLKNNHHTYVNSTRASDEYISTKTTIPSSTLDINLFPGNNSVVSSGLGEQHSRNHRSMTDEPSHDSTVVYSLAGGIDMECGAAIKHIVTAQDDEYALPSRAQHSGKDGHLTGAKDDNEDLMVDNQHYGSIN